MAKRKRKVYPGSLYVPQGRTQIRAKIKNDDYKPGVDPPGREFKTVATGFPDTPQGWVHAEAWLERVHLQRRGLILPDSEVRRQKKFTLEEVWNEFIRVRKKQLLPETERYYELCWNTFVINSDRLCTHDDILYCIREFAATHKVSKSGFNTYLRGFQVVTNWAARNGFLDKKINAKEFYYRNLGKQENKTFSKDEFMNLFIYFWRRDAEFALMLELMYYTGARIGDVLTLTWEQVDFKKQQITWRNKITKKPEPTPVAKRVLQGLSMIERKGKNRIKVFRWQPSTYSRLVRRLHDAMQAMGIPRDGRSFHEFRRTFCNTVFDPENELNLPLNLALQLVRHKTVDVTIQNYLETDTKRMSDAVNRL